jgi:hypothetical protein
MNEHIAHSDNWQLAVIMIVLASWFFYRYLAPKTWREWASAGLVQAFIIALYAEMYGFPLTIYLIVRFFGIDSPNLNANLWTTFLGIGELGMMISMILGYALLFIGIGLFIQGWRNSTVRDRKTDLLRQVCIVLSDIRNIQDCSSVYSVKASSTGQRYLPLRYSL